MPELSRFYNIVIKMLFEEELYAAWNKAVSGIPFEKIAPLQ
jgi:hypothetical protein